MSKYDGPSYKKNQKRLKKSEFPFYRDSAHATKKDNLFDRSKTSKYEEPIKITRELNVDTAEKLFSEQVDESNHERTKRLSNKQTIDNEIKSSFSYKKNSASYLKEEDKSEGIFEKELATYQKRRSSTPFKVQKIPSPYYGLNKHIEKETTKVNYKNIATSLQKEEDDFILSHDHLCERISKRYTEDNSVAEKNHHQVNLSERPKKKLNRSIAKMI